MSQKKIWEAKQQKIRDLILRTCLQVLEDPTMSLADKLRAAEILSARL